MSGDIGFSRVSVKPIDLPKGEAVIGISSNEATLASPEEEAPFSAKHYGLSQIWNDPDAGFTEDIDTIESYFRDQVFDGAMSKKDDLMAEMLKKIEHEAGVDKHERVAVKVAQVAAYMKFLKQQRQIQRDKARYAFQEEYGTE